VRKVVGEVLCVAAEKHFVVANSHSNKDEQPDASIRPAVGAAISRDNDGATAVVQGVIFRPSSSWAKFHGAPTKSVGTG